MVAAVDGKGSSNYYQNKKNHVDEILRMLNTEVVDLSKPVTATVSNSPNFRGCGVGRIIIEEEYK
jgi:hypothetical protein